MTQNTYCSSLWNHQMIDTTGRTKPCCRFVEESGTNNNINNSSIADIFNSDYMKSLRDKSLNNIKISGCVRCYEEQENNKKSLRQRINENPATNVVDVETPKINYLELAISNDCNLMCRICSSRYSQKLYQDEVDFFGRAQIPSRYTRSNIDTARELLPDLKYIKFTGGEPLIIKEHWELLELAISLGYAKNITLNYSTNCTVWPKERIVNIWRQFKKIELALSLDSIIAEENEYQRHLTDHKVVLQNIEKYKELESTLPIVVSGRPTVSVYNLYHLPETVEWLHDRNIKVNPTHLTYPAWLSITVLPSQFKNVATAKFTTYKFKRNIDKDLSWYLINYMNSRDDSSLLPQFIKYTKFLDQKRNQNFNQVFWYFENLINS